MTIKPDLAWVPEPSEQTVCPLCESQSGEVVGTLGRHGVPVRNVACHDCGTVYVNPRPSPEQMGEFYRSHYRTQHMIPMQLADGTLAMPDTPNYELATSQRGMAQGRVALSAGRVQPGDKVLDVGCRRGLALRTMRDEVSIEPYGVEPGESEAAIAIENGINMHVGLLETFDPGDIKFDQIQMFHVLEHVHEPLECLIRLRSMLKPNGRLVIELPDVLQPYGGLTWFFQYPHLYSFSLNSLMGLFRRAGIEPVRTRAGPVVFLVGHPIENPGPLPRPFSQSMLPNPEQDGVWVTRRLSIYEGMEQIRKIAKSGRNIPVDLLVRLLAQPSLPGCGKEPPHSVLAAIDIIEELTKRRDVQSIIQVLEAVISGPHDEGFKEFCQSSLAQIERPQASAQVP
jgi:SAM-dependent methyltransferase